jgi:hypothetical protein
LTDERAVLLGEQYGGMIVAPVRLLGELVRLNAGNVARFRECMMLPLDTELSIESRESGERKHELAEEFLAKTKITQGLFLILVGRA